jgi:hypothetical protein
MYQINYSDLDVILMMLVPPQLGLAVGLLVGLVRRRLGQAAIGGSIGGTVGAWAGLLLYRSAVLPEVSDPVIFQWSLFAGLFLGSVPLAWLWAGTPDASAKVSPCAVLSLVSSDLGYVGALVFIVSVAGMPQDESGLGPGLGLLCIGFPSGVLCLLGIVCGGIALINGDDGPGKAWTGTVLGCLPLAAFAYCWSADIAFR